MTCRAICLLVTCFFILKHHVCQAQSEADDAGLLSESNSRARPVVVNLPGLGKVQGRRDGPIDFFGGLPYAAPPVGNLRWAPPEVSETIPATSAKVDADGTFDRHVPLSLLTLSYSHCTTPHLCLCHFFPYHKNSLPPHGHRPNWTRLILDPIVGKLPIHS